MSVLSLNRPVLLVGAAAVALLVVGAGGAIGIGTSGPSHHNGAAARTPARSGPGGGASPVPASSTTTPSTTVPAQTPTSVGSVPLAGQGSSPSTARVTTTTNGPPGSTGAPPGSPPASSEPATGTYDYATHGSSSVFGQTYPSPATTTIVISRSGCGEADQWNEAPGDSTTIVGCPVAGGIHIVSETSETTVDEHTMTQTFTCDANSFVPLSGQTGQTWKWACHTSNGDTSEQTVTLDGPVTLIVSGTKVTTEHVSILSVLSGSISGHSDTEDWLNSVGLRIKETGNIDATEYGVTFQSNYTIELDALKPS